jgi:hypothetical protein
LAARQTGRIVIQLSGGAKVRLEVVRFADVALDGELRDNGDLAARRKSAAAATTVIP